MAYMWDDKGNIKMPGLPDGTAVNLQQYQASLKQYNESNRANGYYSTMNNTPTKVADSISKFIYRDGKVQGFIPELKRKQFAGKDEWIPATTGGMVGGMTPTEKGFFVDVGGIVFDETSKSGDIQDGSEVVFKTEGGAPLAEFQRNGKTMGYMRLATNQEKQADNLRLGNKSGTQSGNVRQNAQRKTLL